MVKAVPSRPTRDRPAARMRSAVGSAMCSKGRPIAACTSSAMRCMVLVQITTISAPPRSSRRAASIRAAVASSQRPACCNASISPKSNDHIRQRAERKDPRRARTVSLTMR